MEHYTITDFVGEGILTPESGLTLCRVFRQTPSMEAEIDDKLPSNSS